MPLLTGIIGAIIVPVVTGWVVGDASVLNTGARSRPSNSGTKLRIHAVSVRACVMAVCSRWWTSWGSNHRLVGRVVTRLAVLVVGIIMAVRCANTGLLGSVAIADVGRASVRRQCTGVMTQVGIVALPSQAEETTALATGSFGVVVVWTGSEFLLLVVVTDQCKFDQSGEEEEEAIDDSELDCPYSEIHGGLEYSHSNDGDRETGSLQSTGRAKTGKCSPATAVGVTDVAAGVSGSENGVDVAPARASTMPVGHSQVYEGADEADIEGYRDEGEKRMTSYKA